LISITCMVFESISTALRLFVAAVLSPVGLSWPSRWLRWLTHWR
jgi:hypothetical protein